MNIKKHIPNLFTLGNLLCGCIGIVLALKSSNHLGYAAYLIGIACVFDFLDGFVARQLGTTSELGKQLDSLADIVTFGLLPSIIIYQMLYLSFEINNIDWINCNGTIPDFAAYIDCTLLENLYQFPAFLIALFSALRLAKFNIDERQSTQFIGVPTPANAVLIASFALIINSGPSEETLLFIFNPYFLYGTILIMSFLLVAELPLIALKFSSFSWNGNEFRIILIVCSLMLFVLLGVKAIPIMIALYILLSLVETILKNKKLKG